MTELAEGRTGVQAASLPTREVLDALQTSEQEGLNSAEAEKRLEEFGPNVLQKSSGDGVLKLLWRQINDPLIYVLLASAALAVALGALVDGLVVLGVVVINTLIGFAQEYKAGKDIEALTGLVPDETTVLRDGNRTSVAAPKIVPGDVVLLEPGDKVAADARLLAERNLQVDESALTGESVPVYKGADPVPEGSPVAERSDMVHGGTLVTSGTGRAVVTATAGDTELGRISEMLGGTTEVETPLTRQITVLGKWITIVISAVAVLLFLVGFLRGYTAVDAVLAAIALAVAAVPEGLPAVITIALAVGVQRMARRRAVIRYLPATETLGSATVICSDKTGTLTKNEMTVKELWTPVGPGDGTAYELSGVGYAPDGGLSTFDGENLGAIPEGLHELLLAGVLCNDAGLARDGEAWRIEGDPTEGALVVSARKVGLDEEKARQDFPRTDVVPFESERQYMATLNGALGAANGQVIYLKGAPEVVLERCDRAAGGAELDRGRVLERVESMANEGLRVLAFAARRPEGPLDELAEGDAEAGFELLGLQGMIDPPREEAIEAVRESHRAGITVKMITGDHAGTAAAIGRQLGLLDQSGAALTGAELDGLSDGELRDALERTNVFARVAPEHKLRLVRRLQESGEVVAMTGDGVNDAPALKQADIGVAMGITGTDVSKESADVVLTDDNFASIAAAVEEGRRVYDNLRKSIAFILPTSVGEGLVILLAVMFFPIVAGVPLLPIQPTQILWVNLVTAVALALPLAFEALEPEAMRRPPRDPKAPIMDRSVLGRTVVVGLLMALGAMGLFLFEFYGQLGRGVAPEVALAEAQTIAVTTVVFFEIFYLLECRSLRHPVTEIGLWTNRWIYVGISVLLLLQLGFVYLPFMNALFHTAPLGPWAWLESLLVAFVVLPVVSLEKRLRRRLAERDRSAKTDTQLPV